MKYYVNLSTQEVTECRDIAMMWYRDGAAVEIWKDGRRILTLAM